MTASVDRSKYFNTWLKNPRGYGHWLFKLMPGSFEVGYTGNFGEALAKAQKYATKRKATRIVVMA